MLGSLFLVSMQTWGLRHVWGISHTTVPDFHLHHKAGSENMVCATKQTLRSVPWLGWLWTRSLVTELGEEACWTFAL